MTEQENKALKKFLLDISCLDALDTKKDDVNIFEVLKVTNTEIRHSNILAWLLDPNENHGIGDTFIKEFITKIVQKSSEDMCNPFDILLQDFYTYQVYREANHMDIVLISKEEKTAIIIENKIWSGESSHQLATYFEKSRTEYSNCKNILYVFLTPQGYDSSNPDEWISFSYEDVINALENATKEKCLTFETSLIIKNYIGIVSKKIMKERDEKLLKICNDIYNKHRTALRLIFENVNIDKSVDSEIICNELKTLSANGEIVYADNNRWEFFTKDMDEFLPCLSEPNSSWSTNWVYYYWLEKYDCELIIHLELGGWNTTEEHKKHMDALIEASGKTNGIKQYKRIFHKKVKFSEENYEEGLKKAVRTLVESALKNEKILLTKAKELLV